MNKTQNPNKATYIIGHGHIKALLDTHFAHLSLTDIDLSVTFNRKEKVIKALLKGKMSIKEYKDGEIIHDPLGVVFLGRRKKEGKKERRNLCFILMMWKDTQTNIIPVSCFASTTLRRIRIKIEQRLGRSSYAMWRLESCCCRP